MVSWDLKVRFLGYSPNIKELLKLAKEQGFSNIERMRFIKIDKDLTKGIYMLVVNDRGTEQKEFKAEVIK